ncbi:MAG: hypothetical protein FD124_3660, partial [Alphaproteobacteria bacterium]
PIRFEHRFYTPEKRDSGLSSSARGVGTPCTIVSNPPS